MACKSKLYIGFLTLSLSLLNFTFNGCSEKKLEVDKIEQATQSIQELKDGGYISKVRIDGTDLIIEGSRLTDYNRMSIDISGTVVDLTVVERADNRILARAGRIITNKIGTLFNLLISNANAQNTVPIQAIVNVGTCANDQVLQGFNSDGSVKCVKAIDWSNPSNFEVSTNRNQGSYSVTTSVAFKVCIQTNQYIETSGQCTMVRLSDSKWRLTSGAAGSFFVGCSMSCYN